MKVKCFMGKHKFKLSRKVSDTIVEYKCENCGFEIVIFREIGLVQPLYEHIKISNDLIVNLSDKGN